MLTSIVLVKNVPQGQAGFSSIEVVEQRGKTGTPKAARWHIAQRTYAIAVDGIPSLPLDRARRLACHVIDYEIDDLDLVDDTRRGAAEEGRVEEGRPYRLRTMWVACSVA
jgi:hypothetical protein